MTDNQSLEPISREIQDELDKLHLNLHIGDSVVSESLSGYQKITEFIIDPKQGLMIGFTYRTRYANGTVSEERTYHHPAKDFLPDEHNNRKFYRLDRPYEDMVALAMEELRNPPEPEVIEDQSTKALAFGSSKARMEAVQSLLQEKVDRAAMMRVVVEQRLWQARNAASGIEKQLNYIKRIVRLLETYLGVYEKVLLIKDGIAAAEDEVITIRQLVLYMDEECGDIQVRGYRNGEGQPQRGIDFRSIDAFDAWLIQDGHYQQIVPEEKCIVALKPTRQQREYSNNPFVNVSMQAENNYTYLLIRNGEKLYRIWTNIKTLPRLFPSGDEFVKIMQTIEESESESKRESAKDAELDWKQQAVMIQGLIERTETLKPMRQPVSLFESSSYENGSLRLIYDAEPSISDGHLPFSKWREQMVEKLKDGDRIWFGPMPNYDRNSESYKWHFRLPWFQKSLYNEPESGVYSLETLFEKDHAQRDYRMFRILYMPKNATVWAGWEIHDRKKRVAFYFQPNTTYYIDYDNPTLDELEFYIHDRIERRNYLNYLPLLIFMREQRLVERDYETELVNLIASEVDCDPQAVWSAVEWWKNKVKTHRSIASEDSKAWRMIRKRLMKEGTPDDSQQDGDRA